MELHTVYKQYHINPTVSEMNNIITLKEVGKREISSNFAK